MFINLFVRLFSSGCVINLVSERIRNEVFIYS
jgi:hypothetical protein